MAPTLFVSAYSPALFHTTSHRFSCCAASPASHTEPNISPKTWSIPPVVFVLGGPGSGKGTQCSRLVRDFGFSHVVVGDLLRREAASGSEEGKIIAQIMQAGRIVPSEITMRLLKNILRLPANNKQAVLIDGFPRNMEQAKLFEISVAPCKFVLYFHCDAEEMRRRILYRARTSGRADDDDQVITKRLKTYIENTMPVIDFYRKRGLVQNIDSTTGGPDVVYNATKKLFLTEFVETLKTPM